MPLYKYTLTSKNRTFDGDIYANDDQKAIEIGKQGKVYEVFKPVITDNKIKEYKSIYNASIG